MIFGLFVHPGTETFFLWQQHAFGSQAAAGTHPRVLGAGKRRFGFRVASAELPRGFREFRGQNGLKITSQSTSGYRDDLNPAPSPHEG